MIIDRLGKSHGFLASLIAFSLLSSAGSFTGVFAAASSGSPDAASSEVAEAKDSGNTAPAEAESSAGEEGGEATEAASAAEDKPKLPSKEERCEQWGDANVAVRAGGAAEALKEGKYDAAINNFRALVGLDSKNPEFHIGLYHSAAKAGNWGQAYLGLEELFELKPEYKKKFAKQFAEVLRQNGDDAEAKEYDKMVSKTAGDGSAYIEKLMADFIDKSLFEKEEAKLKEEYKPPERDAVAEDAVHIHKSKYGLTYENMFQRSESIVIAEYKKFESDGAISFFHPPRAIYRIQEYLKGPPLNPYLPVRYEFCNKIGEEKPDGWKFDKSMMPKPGSKWLIFIYNGVPIDGMFETYHGAFGRQEFTEENYDKIMRIIELHKGQTGR
ncbi:MAG TPA: hypothetical protein PKD05_15385 [Candidatus Melainabacteria bacterium]|nr:hypothetical protein [Candidatus Melainabacteria bacterium]